MEEIITFDEYRENDYKNHLAWLRNHEVELGGRPLTDEEMRELTLSFNSFYCELKDLISMYEENDSRDVLIDDLWFMPYVQSRYSKNPRLFRLLGEGIKYRNLQTLEKGLSTLIQNDNYDLVLVGPQEETDFFQKVDCDLQRNKLLMGNHKAEENLGQGNYGFSFGRVGYVHREFNRNFNMVAPVWSETKGLGWRDLTKEQNAELQYQKLVNAGGSFYLLKFEHYPLNKIAMHCHGNLIFTAQTIRFFEDYAKDRKFLLHINAELKNPSIPTVLYDPRTFEKEKEQEFAKELARLLMLTNKSNG